MKNYKKIIAITAGMLMLTSQVLAADFKVAIVDSQKILEQSTAFKSIREQVTKKADASKNTAVEKEKQLKQSFQDLEGKKKALSKEAFDEKNNKLMKDAEEFSKNSYSERMSIEKAYTDAMGQVEKKMTDIIQAKAAADKINLVMLKANTIYSDPTLDITDGVLKELNSSLADVKVSFDQK